MTTNLPTMGKNDTFGSLVYFFAIAAHLAAASNGALSSARRAFRPRATTLLPFTRADVIMRI